MKTITFLFAPLLLLLVLLGCREESLLTLDEVKSSELKPLAQSEFVLVEPTSGQNPLVFTANWSETVFRLSESSNPTPGGPVSYNLEIDRKGNNFASPSVLAATSDLYAHVLTKDLNQLLLSAFQADPEVPTELELRIVAYYGENKASKAISENTLDLKVTVFKPVDTVPSVYLIGDMNGWNNTSTEFIMYRNSNAVDDHTYTYTGRLAAGTYFKFTPEESLGTYKAYVRKDDSTLAYEESEGGAFFNEVERYVTITIDTESLTYSIVDFDIAGKPTFSTLGPIGGFTNWDNEPPMTKSAYDPHQWSGTFDISMATALKFRANKDWANNWGANSEDVPYGKAVFDGPGADISLPGTYKIYFNDLTGHYVILKQ